MERVCIWINVLINAHEDFIKGWIVWIHLFVFDVLSGVKSVDQEKIVSVVIRKHRIIKQFLKFLKTTQKYAHFNVLVAPTHLLTHAFLVISNVHFAQV